jgi:hypothetical protein
MQGEIPEMRSHFTETQWLYLGGSDAMRGACDDAKERRLTVEEWGVSEGADGCFSAVRR